MPYSITDESGCDPITGTITINQPSEVEIHTLTIDNVTCYSGTDGSATLNFKGGTPPYTVSFGGSDFPKR